MPTIRGNVDEMIAALKRGTATVTVGGSPPAAGPAATAGGGVPAPAPARRGKTPPPARPPLARLVVEVDVNVRLVSEANAGSAVGGGLRAKIGRKTAVKEAVRAALPVMTFPLPAVVTMTRLGGKQLDEDENLPRAFKAVKDTVAAWLGVKDTGRDPRVRWVFLQAPAYRCACRIRIAHEAPDAD